MSFAHPWAFGLGLLAIPLVLLYWRKTPMPQRTVTTDWLWEQALSEERFRARWQKYRTGMSLALHLAVLGLVTIAIAGPLIPGPRYVAIIVDNGVSMQAKDGNGTRLDAAKSEASKFVASLRNCDEAALFTAAGVPSQHCAFTNDRALLQTEVDAIALNNAVPDVKWVIETSRRAFVNIAAKLHTVVITDGCSGDARNPETFVDTQTKIVGSSIGHLALTRFAARRSVVSPETYDILVEVQGFGASQGTLSLLLDGKKQSESVVTIPASGHTLSYLNVVAPVGAKLTAIIKDDANDGMTDNQATIVLLADEVSYAPGTSQTATSSGIDLRIPPELKSSLDSEFTRPAPLPLWVYPAGLALVLMVMEWCLYQQRWLC